MSSVGANSGTEGFLIRESPGGMPSSVSALLLNTAGLPMGAAGLVFNYSDQQNYDYLRLSTGAASSR